MPFILHTGMHAGTEQIQKLFPNHELLKISPEGVTAVQLEDADLFIIGPEIRQPVRAAQQLSKKNNLIAIAIVADYPEFENLKKSLLFSPFIGKNTYCFPNDEMLSGELQNAALQTRQRRKFARINRNMSTSVERNINVNRTELIGNFLDQAPIGAIILNKEKLIVAINRFARREFRLQPLQQVQLLTDIFSESIVNQIVENMEGVKKPQEINFDSKYFELTFTKIFSEQSENLDILLFTDITEKKLENQRIRNVLDALPQMAWTTNAEGEVTYFTEGWYRYTGQSLTEAMGEGYKNVIHPDDVSELQLKWNESVATKKPLDHEARYRRHTGEFRWHLVRGIPIFGGNRVLYWMGVCTDIHDQKMQEQILKEKVEARTRDLSEVNSLLERSNNDLKEFAYVASHDLKEPVRKIKLFIDRYLESTEEKDREMFINKIDYTADGMLNLIEGIMSYSQLSGSLQKEKVDLNKIVVAAENLYELEIEEKKAHIIYSRLPVISGEKSQILQLFSNLLSNSLKYSQENPKIEITWEKIRKDGIDYFKIDVKDNGIGFEEKYAENIFVIFKRLHTKDRYPGSGIGLALAKKIMTNHKGDIIVKSEPGKGTVFSLLFPQQEI